MSEQRPEGNQPEEAQPPDVLPADEPAAVPTQRVRRDADYDREQRGPDDRRRLRSDEPSPYYDEDDDLDRSHRDTSGDAVQYLIPMNVSAWSMAACYVGLISMCIPFLGILLGIAAIIFGIVAMKRGRLRKTADYGKVTGDIRAILGIVFGMIAVVWQAIFVIVLMLQTS